VLLTGSAGTHESSQYSGNIHTDKDAGSSCRCCSGHHRDVFSCLPAEAGAGTEGCAGMGGMHVWDSVARMLAIPPTCMGQRRLQQAGSGMPHSANPACMEKPHRPCTEMLCSASVVCRVVPQALHARHAPHVPHALHRDAILC
jgi:hypothetical protein